MELHVLCITLLITFAVRLRKQSERSNRKELSNVFFALAAFFALRGAYSIATTIAYFPLTGFWILHGAYLICAVYFMVFLFCFEYRDLTDESVSKRVRRILLIAPAVAAAALVVASAVGGFAFSITEKGEILKKEGYFLRQLLYYGGFALIFAYTVAASVLKGFPRGKRRRAKAFLTLYAIGILGFLIEDVFPFLHVLCAMVSVVMLLWAVRVFDNRTKEQVDFAMNLAMLDTLTGVKNKNAYNLFEEDLNAKILSETCPDFSLAIFDINNLKLINDERGHWMGDQLIIWGASIVSDFFRESQIFRVGGDEFVAIIQGTDYEHRNALLDEFKRTVLANASSGNPTIACGIATYDRGRDRDVKSVFRRADEEMYLNKESIKHLRKYTTRRAAAFSDSSVERIYENDEVD